MKKIIPVFIIFLLAIGISFAMEWHNSLTPKGQSKTITFSQGTKALYTVVYDKSMSDKGAAELCQYLGKIFGAEPKYLCETEFDGKTKYISLGNTELFKNENIATDTGEDGYSIQEKNNNIYITGKNEQSVYFGIYAILEEDLGYRLWSQKERAERIPNIKDGKLTFVPRDFTPAFITRSPSYEDFSDKVYIDKNRFHKYDAYGGVHTSFSYVSPDNFKEHPEWFSFLDGKRIQEQLCWSNPQVIDMICEKAKKLAKEGHLNLAISPEDTDRLCDCEECNRLDIPNGTKAATYINTLNTVLERLTEEFPDLHIIALAYHDYITPPKTIKPHKNLSIMMCSDCCDWKFPFRSFDETEEYQTYLKNWVSFGSDTLTWNYVTDYDHYLLPNPNITVIAKNIKLLKDWKVGGVFLQGAAYDSALCSDGELKTWVWGKLLENPDRDVKELMQDFIYGYYGECADIVWEYENSLIDLYEKGKAENKIDLGTIRWTPDAEIYTEEFCEKSMALMAEAEKTAKNPEIKARIDRLKIGPYYLKIGRTIGYFQGSEKYIKKDFDKSKTQEILNLVNNTDKILIKLKSRTVAETHPWDGNRKTYMEKWRRILTADDSDLTQITIDKHGWKFIFDEKGNGDEKEFVNLLNTDDWNDIEAELTWDEQNYPRFFGTAWYKKDIDITEDMLKNENIYLVFEGIDEEGTVYINGNKLAEHTTKATGMATYALYVDPVICDIKPYVKVGINHITCAIGNYAGAGGIYKPVKIILTSQPNTENDIRNKLY